MKFIKVGTVKNLKLSSPKTPSFQYSGQVGDMKNIKPVYTNQQNTEGTTGSFFKGWTNAYDNIASGVNWVGEKLTGLVGANKAENFFHTNREYWNNQRALNNLETTNHPIAHTVGELLNPSIFLPAGYFRDGAVAADMVKSAIAGGILGGGEQGLSVAGRNDLTNKQKIERTLTGAAFGGIGNGLFRGGEEIWGKLFSKNKGMKEALEEAASKGDSKKVNDIINTIKSNPKEFGLTTDEATSLSIVPYEKPIEPELINEEPINMYPNYSKSLPNENAQKLLSTPEEQGQQLSLPKPTLISQLNEWSNKDLSNMPLEELQRHPFYNDIIDTLKDVKATDKRYTQKKVSDRFFDRDNNIFIGGSYEPNYLSDYQLSKSSINRILKGKPNEEDLQKLRNDLQYETERALQANNRNPDLFNEDVDNELNLKAQAMQALENKNYDKLENLLPQIKDEDFKNDIVSELSMHPDEKAGNIAAQYLFANANQRLAGGMLGGTYNALENSDENNDGYITPEERMNAFLKGFGVGMLSPEALKVLEKVAPETYNKLKSIATTDTGNGEVAGAFFNKASKSVSQKTDPYADIAQYNKELNEKRQWQNIDSNTILGGINRLFSDTRSGEYQDAFSQMQISKNKYNEHLENLHSILSDLPKKEKTDLIDYLENVKGKQYSPEIQQLGEMFKQTIGNFQKELKDAGFSPDYIDKYGVNYVARLYKDKLGLKRIGDIFHSSKLNIWSPNKERGLVKTMSEKELQDAFANGELDRNMVGKPLIDGGIEVVPIPNKKGMYKVKRDWTPEEREKMGQIKEAESVLPLTLMRLHSMKVMKDFFERVSNIEGATIDAKKYLEESGLDPKEAEKELKMAGYVKLPNNEKFGALANQWVRKDVADDISYIEKQTLEPSKLKDLWFKYLTAWKKSKTIYNPSAHFNNFLNNLALANYAGMPLKDIPKYFTRAISDLKAEKELKTLNQKVLKNEATDSDKERIKELSNRLKYVTEAKNNGLLDTSMIKDITAGAAPEDNAAATLGGNGILGKTIKFANDMYQGEDNVGKLAMYSALREHGYSEKEAHQITTLFMPDYTKALPKGIRILRDTGLAPFISWTYYVLPHLFKYTYRDLARAIKHRDIKQLGKFATSHPVRKMLKFIATIEGLQYLLTKGEVSPYADLDPNDKTKPNNTRFIRMGIGAHNGVIDTLKIDRLFPQTSLIPTQWAGQIKQLISGLPLSALYELNSNEKLYNGRPITYPSRPVPRQVYDEVHYTTEEFAPVPTAITQAYDTFINPHIQKVLYPNQKKRGVQLYQDRTLSQNLLKLLTGINTLSYDKRQIKDKNK